MTMFTTTNILDLTYILKVSVLFLGFIISISMLIFIKYIMLYLENKLKLKDIKKFKKSS